LSELHSISSFLYYMKTRCFIIHSSQKQPNLKLKTRPIAKFKTSKFQISPSETEILWSTFESTKSEGKSQESTLQLNDSKVLYQENFVFSLVHFSLDQLLCYLLLAFALSCMLTPWHLIKSYIYLI
jgi:hypothetical protein